MRILYIDIDSLRRDHLSCYGYHRPTSPNIDALASQGVRFNNCYATDVPCLPSRTALFSGRAGIHTGVINHGGVAAQPFIEGEERGFRDQFDQTCWMRGLRKAGLRTTTISPFGERHAAWWWYAGFNEIINPGKGGNERADEVSPMVLDWLERRGKDDNWFLHVNLWDPHTFYRTPEEFGDPFKDEPTPAWLTEDVRREHWAGVGPHSAQEIPGFTSENEQYAKYPRQPTQVSSMEEVRRVFDGYDTGVRYADHHLGLIIDALKKQGIYEETVIVVSADHGENLGELNIYSDHQVADQITANVPLIVRWPGVTDSQQGRLDEGLIHHYDFAATMIELLGQDVPGNWDGRSFADVFKDGREANRRDFLVLSQGAWSCQRSVRFNHEGSAWLCIRSYHDGYHGLPDVMLFNLTDDPHEQHDLANARPELVDHAMTLLSEWHARMMRSASHGQDPMWTVINEGGAFHTRGRLPAYLERLRKTGRSQWADRLETQHAADLAPAGNDG